MISRLLPEPMFEHISLVAPLGLRFWDLVTDALLTTGLTVVAAPQNQPGQTVTATVSPSGIYGFAHLPGLRELENGEGDKDYWERLTDAQRRPFRIKVTDSEGHFNPFTLNVTAPQRRVYAYRCADATVMPNARNGAIPLFSRPARPIPSGIAVIRAEVKPDDKPAAWAVVEVRQSTTVLGHGLVDERGQVAVIFPYPPPNIRTNLLKQSWQLELHTYYDALSSNDSKIPDLCELLKQPLIRQQTVTLQYGQELIVR